MNSNILLEVTNLNVILEGDQILKDVSFQVQKGEMLTILGANGSGKSVLLKTILGLMPYTGIIKWNGAPKIGYLPQGLNQLRVKDLPLTVLDFFSLKNHSHSIKEIEDSLLSVGLEKDIISKRASTLSGGQFQRMLIAWVFISRPDVVFLDEPTTGVDIGGGETVYSLLHNIQEKEKTTIFLVTHDLHIVYKHSTHVLCLNRKGYYCFGEPKETLSASVLEEVFGKEIKIYTHQ